MKVEQLAEVVWQLFEGGRPTATNQTLEQDDVRQIVYMQAAYQLKMRFYESRKMNDGEKTDFIGGLLGVRQYDLSEADIRGKRSVTYNEEVMRLPRNSDVTNVYMVASNCNEDVSGIVTQVQPAEENFYMNDPDLGFFKFYVQKGNKIDTYNIPDCIEKIEVERVYTTDDLEVPLDIAYEVATNVLGVTLKVRGFIPTEDNPSDGNRNQLRYQLEEQDKKM